MQVDAALTGTTTTTTSWLFIEFQWSPAAGYVHRRVRVSYVASTACSHAAYLYVWGRGGTGYAGDDLRRVMPENKQTNSCRGLQHYCFKPICKETGKVGVEKPSHTCTEVSPNLPYGLARF